MAEQNEAYLNLEKLHEALIEERRSIVQRWGREQLQTAEAAAAVVRIQTSLAAVQAAMDEEYESDGITGFLP